MAIVDMKSTVAKDQNTMTGKINEAPKKLNAPNLSGMNKLFLPLVKIAKTNKIIKNILEHIAVHSTIDMRQSMRGKKHLLGRVYRKILLPICYWAGKK